MLLPATTLRQFSSDVESASTRKSGNTRESTIRCERDCFARTIPFANVLKKTGVEDIPCGNKEDTIRTCCDLAAKLRKRSMHTIHFEPFDCLRKASRAQQLTADSFSGRSGCCYDDATDTDRLRLQYDPENDRKCSNLGELRGESLRSEVVFRKYDCGAGFRG